MHIHNPNFLIYAVSEPNFEVTVMEFENEPYRGEHGEPFVDCDKNVGPEGNEPHQHALDVAGSNQNEKPPTKETDGSNSKCRKLIIKIKSGTGSGPAPAPVNNDSNSKCRKLLIKLKSGRESGRGLDGDGVKDLVREDCADGSKRKKKKKGEDRRSLGKKGKVEKEEKISRPRVKKSGAGGMRDHDADNEIKEMWDTIVGGNCEDDKDGVRAGDEDKTIDDSCVDPSHHYGSDNVHSPGQIPQPEEEKVDDEIEELFKIGRKKKKEPNPSATRLLVESVVAELDVAADEDAELNRQEKPAITKLRHLSLLTDIIPRKHLQQEFLDCGVLNSFKKWLEPVPDGSFPNITVREAVFKCLNELFIDLEREDRREQLGKSGIGKAIIFFSKYDEETTGNRKLAKQLVEKWSRVIFDLSTDYGVMKNYEVKRTYRRPPVNKAMSNAAVGASRDHDLDLHGLSLAQKSGASSSRQHASRPEAMPMDFVVRPQSKVDPEAVRALAKRKVQDQPRAKLSKKLEQMKAPKRKQLQAVKPSVEGRGMVKYL